MKNYRAITQILNNEAIKTLVETENFCLENEFDSSELDINHMSENVRERICDLCYGKLYSKKWNVKG